VPASGYHPGVAGSLITPEAEALVGKPDPEPRRGTVLAREVARFCHAVGDLNPIYFDEAAARAAGYRRAIAPPTFLQFAVIDSVPIDQVRNDGLVRDSRQRIPLKVGRTMFGGDLWEHFEPACHGDEVVAETRLISLQEKQGREGPFVLLERETTYRRAEDGVILARNVQRTVVR
jgi:acyl dehydratase